MAMLLCTAIANGQSTTPPAGMTEKSNLRNVRYCEVFVISGGLMSVKAAVYNTLGLNDCPAATWASLNVDKLKTELHARKVILNGPRYFIMDRNALQAPGATQNFGGLEARFVTNLEIHPGTENRVPYTENTVERQSQYVYEEGKNVYELFAPDGRSFIMQSYSQEVDKNLNEEGLLTLDKRLKLPKGWQYRVRKLENDLVVRNGGTTAHVLQDELKNTYQRTK
jgi:haloalkane dehalogenase